ncbi:MAG TPA: DUF2358 domain-containing protein [Kamptonema sp.]|nr:DUF2358 domain-containing protein [Kamptonema sp.]
MNIIEIIKEDYKKFPAEQTYSIYAKDVYFQDPVNRFRGIGRYQQMIGFMSTFFKEIKLDLHSISHSGDRIETQWTLSWTVPVPWQPRIAIAGWSELKFDTDGLICSHIDYWKCSRLDVLKQLLFPVKTR